MSIAPVRTAFVKSESVRIAFDRFASAKRAFLKSALVRFALSRFLSVVKTVYFFSSKDFEELILNMLVLIQTVLIFIRALALSALCIASFLFLPTVITTPFLFV